MAEPQTPSEGESSEKPTPPTPASSPTPAPAKETSPVPPPPLSAETGGAFGKESSSLGNELKNISRKGPLQKLRFKKTISIDSVEQARFEGEASASEQEFARRLRKKPGFIKRAAQKAVLLSTLSGGFQGPPVESAIPSADPNQSVAAQTNNQDTAKENDPPQLDPPLGGKGSPSQKQPGQEKPAQDAADEGSPGQEGAGQDEGQESPGGGAVSEAEQAAGKIDPKMIQDLGGSAADLLAKGKRPPDDVIWQMAEKLLMLAGVPPRTLSLIRIGIKLLGESDKEILQAIWPEKYPEGSKKDLDSRLYLANPAKYINKAKLQEIARRVVIKLVGLVAITQLLTWILLPAIFLTITCVTIKNDVSWFDPAGAAIKTVSWATGLTDLCNKIMSGSGGGRQGASGCHANAEADRPRLLGFIHIAHAQNATCYNGPIGTGVWKDKINQYSNRSDLGISLDPCILTAIVERESHGDPNVVGYDGGHHPDPANGITDQFDPAKPPKYNLNWKYSHGIGLTQWTVFPDGDSSGGGSWPDPNIPQRKFSDNKWYTVQDLLNPDTSLDLTSRQMAAYLRSENNNLQQAFADYNGGPHTSKQSALDYGVLVIKLYNQCKLAGGGGV